MGRFADMAQEIRAAATALDELAQRRVPASTPTPTAPPAPSGGGTDLDTTAILNRLDALDRRLNQRPTGTGTGTGTGNFNGTDFRALVGLGD